MHRFSILIVFASLIVSGCQQQNGPLRERVVNVWEASEQQLAELQARSSYEGYSIQLPKDFKDLNSNSKKPPLFASNKGKTTIAVEYGTTLYGPGKKPTTAEQLVLIMSKSLKGELVDFQQSPPEVGTIGSTEFASKTWSGTVPQSNVQMSGTMYCAVIDGEMVTISAQTIGEEDVSDLKLAEAAIYTFQPE